MKTLKIFAVIFTLLFVFGSCSESIIEEPEEILEFKSANKGNEKITGFDQWGYNWNAHQFNGYLINAWFGDEMDPISAWYKHEPYNGDWVGYAEDYPEVLEWDFYYYGNMTLVMHWNESMISSEGVYPEEIKDTDAWITFHYRAGEGKDKWSQFQKYVAVSSTDTLVVYFADPVTEEPIFGEWFSEEGESLGWYYLWSDRALVQVVNTGNVPEGMLDTYKGPLFGPGLGKYKNI